MKRKRKQFELERGNEINIKYEKRNMILTLVFIFL